MYKRIGNIIINSERLNCDEIQADFDEEVNCARLSFFKNGHFQDEIVLNITSDEHGIYSDVDKWKMRALDLAADLYMKEEIK